uniref:ranBP2-type zinc finger protein At1g67325 isoform X2 n=1 Tax=Erigeron canadensis TaxID=72917 RepID=UPI001CB91754|nr:ranBP2-type zinc finger protein At1g67325 isoform X2 [Erigeron canadensis]
MSQVDNRNSSASKRARTDGGRREDDWTCPSCGNVNFSFRTSCNMRNCTQPRPADHNSKSAPKPMQTQQGYSPAAPYAGPGAPSSMYIGVSPYASSMFNGSSVPPYDAGSAYPYNYGSRGGSPYRPVQLSGPPPYSGGMYGIPQLMERFGLGLPLGHNAMGPRPGFFSEDRGPKRDGKGDNDWECPKCGNVNFAFRTVCNMRKCNTPKPGSQAPKADKGTKPDMPEGSWKCDQCNNINYPFRTKCNRQNCGAEKPSESQKSPSEEAVENDQVCFVMCLVPLNLCCLKMSLFVFVCTSCECNVKTFGSHLHMLTTFTFLLPYLFIVIDLVVVIRPISLEMGQWDFFLPYRMEQVEGQSFF